MAVKEFIEGELYVLDNYAPAPRFLAPFWVDDDDKFIGIPLKHTPLQGNRLMGRFLLPNGCYTYWPPEHAHKVVTEFEVGKRYLIRRPTGSDSDPMAPWVPAMDGLAGKVGTCVKIYAEIQDYKSASLKVDGAGTFTYRNTHCLEIYEPDVVAKEPEVAEVKAKHIEIVPNKRLEAGVYATITPEQPVEIPTANEVLEAVPVVGVTEGTYASSFPADLSLLAGWEAEPKVKFNPKFRRLCRHDWVVGEEHTHEWGPKACYVFFGVTGLAILGALGGAVANSKGLFGASNDPFALLLLGLATLTGLTWFLLPEFYPSPETPLFTRRRQDKICMKCGRTSLKLTAHKQKELAKRAAATAKACAEQQKIDDRVELERQALEKLKSYTTLARKAQA